jgi:hypothetical protein
VTAAAALSSLFLYPELRVRSFLVTLRSLSN